MPDRERIWIIGASAGIGAALARAWAQDARDGRVQLILSARSTGALSDLLADLGPDHIALPCDVGDPASLQAAADQLSALGPLDRIIHLAALYDPGKLVDQDPEIAAQIVAVNLMGSFHVAQLAAKLLRPGGQLALCGSAAGFIGLPQGQIYSATKAGVINLAESLRSEWAGRFDVRLISPGFVDTRLTQKNEFTMPAMIPPDRAARNIIDGLNSRAFEIHFPRRFTRMLKLISALPYRLSLPMLKRLQA
jgi:NAD(P)-dependent dehydrogenase (short-subunit alcohol dehydrogenase family)